MLAVERRKSILDFVNTNGSAMVADLSKLLKVTDETVRRDLQKLEEQGMVYRTHGGAIPCGSVMTDLAADVRQKINIDLKQSIAKEAAKLVEPGDTVFMDSSTTAYFLAHEIKDKDEVTVITNSFKVLSELTGASGIRLVAIGGVFSSKSMSFRGSSAEKEIRRNYGANKFFCSCKALSKSRGLCEGNEAETEIKKAMLDCSEQLVLMCDHSKIDKMGSFVVSSLDRLDYFCTDPETPEDWLRHLGSYGAKIRTYLNT